MVVFSKFRPVNVLCKDVHIFQDDCLVFTAEQCIHVYYTSFQMYFFVYLVALLMRGKIPKLKDLKKTLFDILQSSAFLSGTAFGYGLFLCGLRRILGSFYTLTLSFLPAFLASVFAILIERPSRRTLLCLYVSNVATETVWNMMVARNMVTPIKYGQVAIFGVGMALLLTFWRAGLYDKDKMDPMYKIFRFIIGPYEEECTSCDPGNFCRQEEINRESWSSTSKKKHPNFLYHLLNRPLRAYWAIVDKIKYRDRYSACPHPFSCVYYTLQGTAKMFSLGLGLQLILKLGVNIRTLLKSPKQIGSMVFRRDILKIANFLGGFCGIFRVVCCLLRRGMGKDNALYAVPAGLLAGLAFTQYPDITIALYVFWKAVQITYSLCIEKGYAPEVFGFNVLMYCLSTGILFHVAFLEPQNLRSSYWRFLTNISGGRVTCFNRKPFDTWGLGSSQRVMETLLRTKTKAEVEFLGRKWK